jgi:hypothetical protein
MKLTQIKQKAEDKPFLTKEEKEHYKKIHSIAFLDFLFDRMNPNEMEDYISMYLSADEKA